ncbi:MAG TPA: IS630 family transposase [Flavobacteriaceae bacterium]
MNTLSEIQKGQVIECIIRGDTKATIADRFNISTKNVRRLKKRYFETGTLKRKSGSGRPKKWGDRSARQLKRHVLSSQHGTLASALPSLNLHVSKQTASRMMQHNGYSAIKKIKKPAITEAVAKLRLEYAEAHKNWSVENWSRVLFTDETKVNLCGSDGINYFWGIKASGRKKTIPLKAVKQKKKFGGGGVMFWGCFGWKGIGFGAWVTGTMDKKLYLEILNDEMKNSLEYSIPEGMEPIIMHDNAPCHTAKDVKDWLKEEKIETLPHPPYSPDLNPIEHLWNHCKKRVYKKKLNFKTKVELQDAFAEEFYSTDVNYLRKMIESMPRRIKAVIDAKGFYTTY